MTNSFNQINLSGVALTTTGTTVYINQEKIVIAVDTGNLVTTSQTGGFLTASTAGGVNKITTTGAYPSGFVSGSVFFSGISIISITTGAGGQIVVSGDTGAYANFVSLSQTGGLVSSANTGTFVTTGSTGLLTNVFYPLNNNPAGYITSSSNVRSIAATGITNTGFVSGDVMFTGAGNVVVSTGIPINKLIVVSGNTGAYANFITPSQTGNFITNGMTGNFVTTQQSGLLTNVFYPLNSNPSGYIRESNGNIFATGFTGQILDGQILIGSTGQNAYIAGHLKGTSGTNVQSGSGFLTVGLNVSGAGAISVLTGLNSYIIISGSSSQQGVPAGVNSVGATGITNTGFFTGDVLLSGAGNIVVSTGTPINKILVVSGNTGAYANFTTPGATGLLTGQFYPLNQNPSGYISSISGVLSVSGSTGILDGQLLIGSTGDSAFIQGNLAGTSGIFVVSGSGSLLVIADSSIVRTSQTGGFGGGSISVTGATVSSPNFTGAGNVLVYTGNNPLVIVSGNTGAYANFVTLSQTGNVVNTSQTGGFTSFKVTGSSLLSLVNLTGADNTVVTTGGGGLVITSGSVTPTFSYSNFTTTSNNPSYSEGRLFYDTGEKSLAYYNDNGNVTQNLGQENWIRVINVSNAAIANGKAVYVTGSISGLPAISLAQANSESGSFAVGVTTVDIPQSGRGYVTTVGVVHTINVSGFIPGTKIYLSETTTGAFTNTRPTGNNYVKPIGYVISTGISGLTGNVLVVPSDNYKPDNFYLSGSGLVAAGNVAINIVPTGVIISGNTGAYANFVTLSQTGNVVNTSQTGGFLTLGNVGGVRTLQTTGAFPSGFTSGNVVISGAGTISVTTGVNASIVISGTAGQQQGSAAGVNTLGVTGIINTGYFTGDLLLSGAGNITVYTGSSRTIVISGTTPVVNFSGLHNIWIPAAAMTPSFATGATTGTIFTSGSGHAIDTLDFLSGSGQSAYFNLSFPQVWDKGTVYPIVYWTTTGNTNGTINWGVAAGDIKDGGNLNIQYNQGTTIADTAISGNFLHQTTGAPLTISGSLADYDNCYFKIYRSAGGSLAFPGNLIGLNIGYYETGLSPSISGTQQVAGGSSLLIATGTINSGIVSGSVALSGAGNINVFTGASNSIVISGDTGAYSVFALKSETGQFITTAQTGQFVNTGYLLNSGRNYNHESLSFYHDFGTITGLNLQEYLIQDNLVVTGLVIACSTSGAGGAHLISGASGAILQYRMTGQIYQRTTGNSKATAIQFDFNSGLVYQITNPSNVVLSGQNRIGYEIYSGLSGCQGLIIGINTYIQ